MNFKTLNLTNDLSTVTGLAVVIDVLRAFTTSCFILNNGANKIIPFADLGLAFKQKEKNSDWVLVGERKGLKVEGADYGNSPTELKSVDLSEKTVILTTSAGTQAIDKLVNAKKIVTGAFVNASAIGNYIQKNNFSDITFICTDSRWNDNEDYKFAEYIKSLVLDKKPDFKKYKQYITNHECADGFLRKPYTKTSKTDFMLSMNLDRFDFVIEAQHDNEHIYLIRV